MRLRKQKERRRRRIEANANLALLLASLVGWPLSAMTFASDEPQTVLGLSWFAITYTAYTGWMASRVHRDL